ncbi:hypothetical protein, partial [Chitiniphilus shinanonensis]|uniref:hypothetical protein n=1 Tax=Chitiniphilus shinanonensis TaxID=553088 RepID=UPI00333E906F
MPSRLAFLCATLCALLLAPVLLHAAPLPASGGDLPVTAVDYFSEDNTAKRRGEETGAVDHVDPLTGGLRIDIPLFSLPGPGGALNLRWTYNSLEPFAEAIRAIRVRDGMGTPSMPVFPTLELPDGTTQRFYPIDPNALQSWGYSAAGQYRTTSNWWLQKGSRRGDAMTLKSPSGTVYQLSVTQLEVKKTLLSANSIQPFNAPQERPTEGRYRNLGGEFDYYLPAASTDANGNRITYSYDGLLLRSLSAADGRSITINWQSRYPEQSQRVASVVAGTRQWLFDYADASQLRIQQPDGLSWFLPYRDWETYMTTNESNSRLNLHQYPLYTGVTLPSGGRTSFEFMRYLAPVPLPEGCTQTNCDKPASIREQPHPAVARKTTSDGGVWVYNHYADWGIDSVLATDVEAIRGDKIAPVIQGRRQVSGPGGITYYTYVSPYDVTDCQNDLWKNGLLLERSDATTSGETLQTTRYSWGYLTIAHAVSMLDSNCRSTVSRVPLQTRQAITRDGKTFTTTQEYDSYGRVIATDESGDNGDSRRTERSYLTDTSRWIIDKVTAEYVR